MQSEGFKRVCHLVDLSEFSRYGDSSVFQTFVVIADLVGMVQNGIRDRWFSWDGRQACFQGSVASMSLGLPLDRERTVRISQSVLYLADLQILTPKWNSNDYKSPTPRLKLAEIRDYS